MGLLSKFKRQEDASAAAPATAPDAVVVARTRARRRLIGATVLLGIGIVGFPLLFETQPRPIPVDIPIEIPRKESAPALSLPPSRPASATIVAPIEPAPDAAPTPAAVTSPSAEVASRPVAAASALRAPPAAAIAAPAAAPSAAPVKPMSSASAANAQGARPVPAPANVDSGQRAQALLDGRTSQPTAAAAEATRTVVQVGAYTDADKLREARQKVEKLGMKTYTQVIEGDGGRRTRVRVGPFATRAEAEKAAARIKGAGLPAAILSL